jgi:hypothetical protein
VEGNPHRGRAPRRIYPNEVFDKLS